MNFIFCQPVKSWLAVRPRLLIDSDSLYSASQFWGQRRSSVVIWNGIGERSPSWHFQDSVHWQRSALTASKFKYNTDDEANFDYKCQHGNWRYVRYGTICSPTRFKSFGFCSNRSFKMNRSLCMSPPSRKCWIQWSVTFACCKLKCCGKTLYLWAVDANEESSLCTGSLMHTVEEASKCCRWPLQLWRRVHNQALELLGPLNWGDSPSSSPSSLLFVQLRIRAVQEYN